METREHSSAEVERLRQEIDTLRKRLQSLAEENIRLRQKLVSVWGE